MSAILDAFAPYVKKLITDMAQEEVSMLLCVSREIEKLESNMESVKDFLADAEKRRITSESVQGWVRKLKNAMYDATDILDLCQLEAEEKRETCVNLKEKTPSCFQPLLFCLRNPVFAHKIGSRIKELNQRLDDIYKGAAKFNFITNLSSYPEQRTPTASAADSNQRMIPEFIESAIVGEKIERDTKELVQVLITDDNHNIKVVSVVGAGGMGKTTLAQKVFNDTTIQKHFTNKIWLGITQHFDEAALLRTAINQARGQYHGGDQDKVLLTQTLREALSSSTFLVVMDDVWDMKAWEHVLSVPITNASHKQLGRVLITTRSGDLAKRMRVAFHQHYVSPLNKEDAWSLLKKQLSPNNVTGIDVLKDVGMRIIEKCGGLPLAIKVMGGLLSTRHPSEREWMDVLNSSAWSVTGLPEEVDNRFYLSYEDLSPQLKQCFLYCSLFPKGISLWQTQIIRMWISEGFIQPQDGGSLTHDDRLEEVATQYYRELITRNLIEPLEGYTSTGYACTMHDVVRSFAEYMAREESLVVVQDEQDIATGGSHSFVRRLSIGPTRSELKWAILQKRDSLRTLMVHCKINFEPRDSLICFPSLRVLYMRGAYSDRLVDSLCKLRHLRYLHLEDTDVSRLPDNIHRLKLLQHIVIDGSWKLDHLPRSIIQLVNLRTLNMYNSNVKVVPKRFGELKNLRILKGFPVHKDMDGGWCSLEEIGPLSQLRNLTLHGLESVSTSSYAEKAMISNKGHLSYLWLNCSSSSSRYMALGDEIEKQQQQQAIEEVFDKLCPPTCIENLGMEGGYFGHRLPYWMMAPAITSFTSLRYLGLEDLLCCTQLPNGLCLLPSLEMLIIKRAPAIKSVGPEFLASSTLAVGGGVVVAFPKLRRLVLTGLSEWEEWEWEEQSEDVTADVIAMPALEKLIIGNCKLSRLPSGLANSKRHALRELKLSEIANLTAVENFPSVVDLDVFDCPELKRISGVSRLQKTRIVCCPNLEVLEDAPALDSMKLWDDTMETVPEYLRGVNPRYLELDCSKKLCESLKVPAGSSEWDKISHIKTRVIGWAEL